MLPKSAASRRFPLTALAFLLATVILAAVLGVVTWRNLDREERLMANFLRAESLTLIRAFEAGARTSLRTWRQGSSLDTLVRETARAPTIAYIAVLDENGQLVAAAGDWSDLAHPPVRQVLTGSQPLARLVRHPAGNSIFEVAKEFTPLTPQQASQPAMAQRWGSWCGWDRTGADPACRQVIFVGLHTREFDDARREDLRQSLLMGGLLLLLGSAGFYFLFLSQKTRVARATLADMELYTRNIIESMPAGLLTVDGEGKIVSGNRRAQEIFEAEGRPLEGMHLHDLAPPGKCDLESLIGERRGFIDRPVDCLRPDGRTVPLKVSASPLTDRAGTPLGTVLMVRDMREIRAMEEQLERSRRHAALGRMAAGIAHEIRNPLGTLRGFAQYFARLRRQDPQAGEYADLMVGEVDRLNRNISALLQFARPRTPEFQSLDLQAPLQRAVRFVAEDAASRGLRLTLDLPEPAPVLQADPDLLLQVLLNLLQNSIAATEAGGEIVLGAAADAEGIKVWVRDSGRGMTAEEREHMFDPFFTTRKEGTGLGLAVVQQIVEQHRGTVEVTSEPGLGTRVVLKFPQEEIDEKSESAHPAG